jgi:hypothetical protein
MMVKTSLTAALVVMVLVSATARADDDDKPRVDRSGYTLFNPTPPDKLREMNSDRPDVTESPYTVDPGHLQAELSFVEYSYDRADGHSDGFSVLPTELRLGLTANTEVELLLNPYQNVFTQSPAGNQRVQGFGDTLLRAKINFWGNDGGDTAFGVIPYVKFPTAREEVGDGRYEGGLILPFAINLPKDFDLGMMVEIDVARNKNNTGYGSDWVYSATLGHPIVKNLAAYVEFVGIAPSRLGFSFRAFADTGLTYKVTENLELDGGVNVALSRSANDALFFVGMTMRR